MARGRAGATDNAAQKKFGNFWVIFRRFPALIGMDNHELEQLYADAFPKVAAMVRRYGHDLETARDVFHDALLVLMERENEPDSREAYVMGIARNLLRRGARRLPAAALSEQMGALVEAEPDRPEAWRSSIWGYVKGRCLDVLKAFYDRGETMEHIAFTYGYASAHSATVQKYKCLERLREQLKTTAIYEEVFA